MDSLQAAIIKTLCYSDIFHYPLMDSEIQQFLIHDTPTAPTQVKQGIRDVKRAKLIEKKSNYYFLQGHSHTVVNRQHYQQPSLKKTHRAQYIAARLARLPYVEAVLLTGTVAVSNASPSDDIDLMIITTPNRLWTARLFVTVYLDLHHWRRHPYDQHVTDKICPNLFLSASALTITANQQNMYTAHEVAQVKFLAGSRQMYRHFLSQNSWIHTYLPNFPIRRSHIQIHIPLPSMLELGLRRAQYWYMKSKQTREIITAQSAFFHPQDLAKNILKQYFQKVRQYGL